LRFALIKGQSQYGSLRLHVDQLAEALVAIGHEAEVVDMTVEGGPAALQAALRARPQCVFGFSGMGCDLRGPGGSVYDAIGSVYASMYVDHPAHHLERLQAPIRRNLAFFLDRSHVTFVEASALAANFTQVAFMPPGANELAAEPDTSDEAFARRHFPLVFTGTYRGPPATYWRDWPEGASKVIAEEVVARMTADARLPLLDALRSALGKFDVALTPELFGQLLPQLRAPQAFAEAYHRDAALHAIGGAGLPLHVWGNGWEPLAERYPSFVYGGVGSFAETLHTLRRARVVLNINNGFVAGGHERVFTAMCAGAAVFSDANRYYEEAFKDGREIATFTWPKQAAMPEQLGALVDDIPRAGQIARAGAKRAQAEHRWTDRAHKLARAVQQAL
jgi:hypothetical protein